MKKEPAKVIKLATRKQREADAISAEDAKKQEIMERLIKGGRRMRQKNQNEHVAYYCILFAAIGFVFIILAMAN